MIENTKAFTPGSRRRTLLLPALLTLVLLIPGLMAMRASTVNDDAVWFCYVPGSGTVYRVGKPDLPNGCHSSNHTLFPVQPAGSQGSPVDAINFQVRTVRTELPEVPFGALAPRRLEIQCEEGEVAISGGGRAVPNGEPNIVGHLAFDKGGGPMGTPPTGWMTGMTQHGGIPTGGNTVEAWVICVS